MNTPRRVRVASALCLFGAPCAVTGAAIAQPANDTCAGATPITLPALYSRATFPGTTREATSDIEQTCGEADGLDVWYSFTAPATGVYTFDTSNSLLFDTTLAAYSNCGGTQLACNGNYQGGVSWFWSAITLNMLAGQTIKIRVASPFNDTEDFVLNIVGTGLFANDQCATPEPIMLGEPKSATTLRATTDFALPGASCGSYSDSGGAGDIFYSFTAPMTDVYAVSLCGATFDTVLAVLTDCSGTAFSVVACNDNSTLCTDQYGSKIPTVVLTSGVRYLIRVAGFDFHPADAGGFTLLITSASGNSGACCRGSTCTIGSAAGCVVSGGSAGARFTPGAACNAAGVATSPCCYADYNKVGGVIVQDIFAFISDWFAGSSHANYGSNGVGTPDTGSIFHFLGAWFAGCG